MSHGVLGLQVTVSQGGATDEHRSWAVRGEPREVALREPAAGIPAAVSVNVAGRSICIFDVRRGPGDHHRVRTLQITHVVKNLILLAIMLLRCILWTYLLEWQTVMRVVPAVTRPSPGSRHCTRPSQC